MSLSTSDNKTFWKPIKVLSKSQCTIPFLRNNGITATTDRDKSNMLNNYFASCWNKSMPPLIEQTSYTLLNANNESFFCSTEEEQALLSNLDMTKATGSDGISARMLKAVASTIAPSLASLYNLTFSKGHFPQSWKHARVVPIPKPSFITKDIPSSFRPISLLSVPSNILRKIIHNLISSHLNEHSSLAVTHSGIFRWVNPQLQHYWQPYMTCYCI